MEDDMDGDGGSQVTGPSGHLAQRLGDHVASANELLQQSHQAVERVRARVYQAHRRVERTFRRVQDAAVAAQAAQRAAGRASERFLQIKQRELAAHLSAAELHEQAAELQDRMGHPGRAAEARAHAEQARAWYRLAGEELDAYEARIAGRKVRRPAAGSP
jgi:hypothetical protein